MSCYYGEDLRHSQEMQLAAALAQIDELEIHRATAPPQNKEDDDAPYQCNSAAGV